MTSPWTLTARWLFPVARPPLPGGTLTIASERIVAVQPHGARKADLDLGDCGILPGLVNAHTHLDLSGMRGLAPPSPDFTAWLRQVIGHRGQRSAELVLDDIRAGLAESVRTGTTLVGDISGNGSSWEALAGSPIRAVVFREMLGLPEDRAAAALIGAREWLNEHPPRESCWPGLSPHSPYSVRSSLFFAAATSCVPVAVHVAETAAEQELLILRRGPLVPFLRGLGVWAPDGLAEDSGHVLRLLHGPSPTLLVHGNYLPPDAPVPDNGSIVFCPRTHAAFGHSPHPFREFLRRGIRVALGTDSLASNPDLDLLAEARFLHRCHPTVPGDIVLRMATLSGAEALGWGDETGSLEVGKSADLVVVPLGEPGTIGPGRVDPHRLLLESDAPVARVLCRGRWLS
jgi:cytosine/adenosine deaminase-related metal-dependent hydrolase